MNNSNLNGDSRLVISGSGEDLTLLSWDNTVPSNELSHNTSHCLDTKSQRTHVQEDDSTGLVFSGEDTSLDGSSVCYCFIRVDS